MPKHGGTPMHPKTWQRIQELFDAAERLAPDRRDSFLDRKCADDPTLARQVQSLIRCSEESGEFITDAVDHARGEVATEPASIVGRRIGAFQVVAELGCGGMGVVYEAEQENPRRRVALKVIHGGAFVDDDRVRMFRREADALARLKHPNIGAIYESGCTAEGHPFFTMELVRGDTLDTYLARRPQPLTRDELALRLRLVGSIADAVNYAHQRGVIHRDLKPSNIVVTEREGRETSSPSDRGLPVVKILDFGLARITGGDVAASRVTEVGMIKGTLPYMSPEQARGETEEIDVRTDVYALGVILYEVLTGKRPYDIETPALIEAVRVICEEPPRPLAQSWSGARRIDRDIETIVGKALEKEPDRRYGSAAALSEDIERHLTLQPILARPPSASYQLRKMVARHRLSFGFAATLLVLLVGFGIGMSALFVRATRSESAATREAATATSVSDFLTSLFAVSDPAQSRGAEITAREVLDAGAARIEQEMADQPEVQARLMHTMGSVYGELGLYRQARPLLEQARTGRRELHGEDHPDTLLTAHALAWLSQAEGDYDAAERLYKDTLARRRRVIGDEHPHTLHTMNNLGYLYNQQRRFEEAEKLHLETLEARRRVLGEDDLATSWSMYNLAWAYEAQRRYDEAEQLYRGTLELRLRVLGDDHPDTLWSRDRLASIRRIQGHLDEAEQLHRETLGVRRRVFGDEHPDTLQSIEAVGSVLYYQKRFEDAERFWLEALEIRRRVLGDDHPDTLRSMHDLGYMYRIRGRLAEAESLLREAIDHRSRVLGDDHLETANSRMALAVAYHGERRYPEAASLFREVLEARRKALGDDARFTLAAASMLATCLTHEGEFAEAESLFREVFETRQRSLGETNPSTLKALYSLGRVAALRSRFDEALALLRQAVDAGYSDVSQLVRDSALDRLRGRPKFESLLDDARNRAQDEAPDRAEAR